MKKVPYFHILLFAATCITTLAAGALQRGSNIFGSPGKLLDGLPFAGTLMVILTVHELAHYVASRRHHVSATLPYFIPAPSLIGTFGAFIKMTSPIMKRSALIDIGASGPIAGFIVSLIASIVGLSMSETVPLAKIQDAIVLGDSLLFSFLSRIIVGHLPDTVDILLHPVAFAGWIGLFVTSLNLLPIGQLDGGHIAFAILGDRHRYVSMTLVAILAVFGFFGIIGLYGWEGWALWALLMLFLGIKHPPVLYWEMPIDPTRRYIALISLLIFIITFIPAPFKI
ncbi:MAG: site-2 protease family protein [Deltaproteobacteria bacterium]|nr:site-2 protease family protein [Deltaproteobacteria bacterium]